MVTYYELLEAFVSELSAVEICLAKEIGAVTAIKDEERRVGNGNSTACD